MYLDLSYYMITGLYTTVFKYIILILLFLCYLRSVLKKNNKSVYSRTICGLLHNLLCPFSFVKINEYLVLSENEFGFEINRI